MIILHADKLAFTSLSPHDTMSIVAEDEAKYTLQIEGPGRLAKLHTCENMDTAKDLLRDIYDAYAAGVKGYEIEGEVKNEAIKKPSRGK